MSAYTIDFDEKYRCPCCGKFYEDPALLEDYSWKCPKCNDYIYIAAPHLGSGHTLIRKSVLELNIDDLVHVPGGEYIYSVVNITNKGTKVHVALKGYRVCNYELTDFVSVIEGKYFEL